jgi:hypothetical protein
MINSRNSNPFIYLVKRAIRISRKDDLGEFVGRIKDRLLKKILQQPTDEWPNAHCGRLASLR